MITLNHEIAAIIQERIVVGIEKLKELQDKGLNSYDRTVLVAFLDPKALDYHIDSLLKHSDHKLDRTFIDPPTTYDDALVGIIIPELRRRLNHVSALLQKREAGQRT